jgi:hypothetical protein
MAKAKATKRVKATVNRGFSAPKAAQREPTKKDLILSMLRRKIGASIDELAEATRWQAHSVRGYLSGTIGKKLKLKVASTKDLKGVRRYAIKP